MFTIINIDDPIINIQNGTYHWLLSSEDQVSIGRKLIRQFTQYGTPSAKYCPSKVLSLLNESDGMIELSLDFGVANYIIIPPSIDSSSIDVNNGTEYQTFYGSDKWKLLVIIRDNLYTNVKARVSRTNTPVYTGIICVNDKYFEPFFRRFFGYKYPISDVLGSYRSYPPSILANTTNMNATNDIASSYYKAIDTLKHSPGIDEASVLLSNMYEYPSIDRLKDFDAGLYNYIQRNHSFAHTTFYNVKINLKDGKYYIFINKDKSISLASALRISDVNRHFLFLDSYQLYNNNSERNATIMVVHY